MFLCPTYLIHQYGTKMSYYATLIQEKTGNIIDSLWGFIDGTIRKTACPLYNPKTVYTKWKKCHGIKFQSVLVPDGYITCLYGPMPVKTHDVKFLCQSNLMEQLDTITTRNGRELGEIWVSKVGTNF